MIRKKIGEILLETGAITQEQLHDALDAQKDSADQVGQILVKKGNSSFAAVI